MFTGAALEWKQPYEYILELPDMNPIWDMLDIYNPEDENEGNMPSTDERRKQIEAFRKAQSERLKKKSKKS
ncbi:MAG: hypothetical protein A4E26_00022 [Methanobacterium sp. PtaU1.Bin097]|jgi:hypothetical protein|nr:MAG: hypothetical protein A4E26_00022 [Methanobacterium sp. PtaU1.Bin097]